MKRFLLSISALLLLTTFTLHAEQNDAPLPTFHTLSVSPHYGQMHYDINLYHLQDPDFDLPLDIVYTSDGFRPFIYSGQVGENWSLQVGGSVTREIIGIADDENLSANYAYSGQKGLLTLLHDTLISHLTDSAVYEEDLGYAFRKATEGYIADLQSDIYTFSFNGYYGRFMMGIDGVVTILSGDYVKVDISKLKEHIKHSRDVDDMYDNNVPNYFPLTSSISITTLDGFTYEFGGNIDALGFSRSWNYSDDEHLCSAADITSWMLTCVTAPNGRRIRFHYHPIQGVDVYRRYTYNMSSRITHTTWSSSTYFDSDIMDVRPETLKEDSPFFVPVPTDYLDKIVLLDSITTSDNSFRIVFQYTNKPNTIYTHTAENTYNRPSLDYCRAFSKPMLGCMKVYNATSLLSQWDFSYQQCSAYNTTRQYLQNVTHQSGIQYEFSYNIGDTSRISDIANIDSVDIYGYRMSNPMFGVLQQAKDPLGCTYKFGYGMCQYDSVRIIKRENYRFYSVVEPYGGKRSIYGISILSVRKTSATGELLSCKKYEYGDYPPMADIPQTYTIADTIQQPAWVPQSFGVLNVDFAVATPPAMFHSNKKYVVCPYRSLQGRQIPPVEYSQVREYICNTETLHPLYRNIYYYDTTGDSISTNKSDDYYIPILLHAYSYISQSHRREALVLKKEYEKSQLRRQTIRTYYPFVLSGAKAASWRAAWDSGKMSYKIYISKDYLTEERIINYEPNGSSIIRKIYERDDYLRLTRQNVYDMDREIFCHYTYPDNLFADETPDSDNTNVAGLWNLVLTSRINNPVEIVQGVCKNNTNYITGGQINLYKFYGYNTPTYSTSAHSSENTAPVAMPPLYGAPCAVLNLALSEPIAERDYTGLSVQNGQLRYDSRYETTSTCTYDSHLRQTSTTPMGQPTTTYIWDDKWLNITSETTGAFTTRYTHIPYVGVSSVTSPQGITTYYTYDTLGNVTEVYQYHNGKKVILQAYKYHYQSQQ